MFLISVSALAVLYFWRQGYLLWWGDATAHLNIARRILDGRNPGYEQIGTVWLPLPHVLMMPFAAVDSLWRSGLAGAIPSALCFVAAGLLLFLIARHSYDCEHAAWAAVLLFALNPNLLYLQSLAMTEAVFVCAVLLTLYASLKERTWLAGLGLLAGSLTRYEGWFLIPFVVLYFFWRDRRAGLVVGLIASIGPLYWLGHNYVFHGDALDFYRGVGSAKWIYEQGLAKGYGPAPTEGHLLVAARYYASVSRLFTGIPILVLGGLGLLAVAARRAWWPIFFLAIGPVFYVWSMQGADAEIHVPHLPPHGYYNTRYGMIVLPLAALAAAAIPAVLPQSSRRWVTGLLVAIAISPWLAYPKQENWVTWKESQVNSHARREWTRDAVEYLRGKYVPGRGIVAHFGDQTAIFRDAGISLRQTVHDGDGLYFQGIVQRPDIFLWQEWVVSIADDPLSRGMAAYSAKVPRYRRVKIVEAKGAAAIEIWRRVTP
ncbi:MAG: ArnT family glycosyltransferase [Bryobacteraceae bacterium]